MSIHPEKNLSKERKQWYLRYELDKKSTQKHSLWRSHPNQATRKLKQTRKHKNKETNKSNETKKSPILTKISHNRQKCSQRAENYEKARSQPL